MNTPPSDNLTHRLRAATHRVEDLLMQDQDLIAVVHQACLDSMGLDEEDWKRDYADKDDSVVYEWYWSLNNAFWKTIVGDAFHANVPVNIG